MSNLVRKCPRGALRLRVSQMLTYVEARLDGVGICWGDDIEIFSDDRTFGAACPDSCRAAPAAGTIRPTRAAFDQFWTLTPQEVEETR